jgi:hypothetical protein
MRQMAPFRTAQCRDKQLNREVAMVIRAGSVDKSENLRAATLMTKKNKQQALIRRCDQRAAKYVQ